MTYPSTTTPFHTWTREQLAAMSDALNNAPVHERAEVFRDMSETLRDLQNRVTDAMLALRAGHEGRAAQAVEAHLTRLAAVGELGEGQASRSLAVLIDQGGMVASARTTIAAAKEIAEPVPAAPGAPIDPAALADYENKLARVREAALAYENGSNTNYAGRFQSYDPPSAATPGTGGSTVSGGGGHVGVVPTGTAPAAGDASTAPAGTGTAAPGGGPTGTVPAAKDVAPVPALPPVGTRPAEVPASSPRPVPVPVNPTGPAPFPGLSPYRQPPPLRADRDPIPPGQVTPWQPGRSWTETVGRGSDPVYRTNPRSEPGLRPGTETPRGLPEGSRAGANGLSTGPAGAASAQQRPVPGVVPPGGGGAGGGQDDVHTRPGWLLEDDPDAIWFAGMPAHCPPVVFADPIDRR